MAQVSLRRTRPADLEFVTELERHPENQDYIGQWSDAQHREAIGATTSREHWIIERDGRKAGYLIAYDGRPRSRSIYVKRILVADKEQGTGKAALTRYRTLQAWFAAVSLLECRLATGRTHQIRVHLSAKGNPVVGDPVYLRRVPAAARAVPEDIRRILLDFPRQALHATRLGFAHPRTGQKLEFTTPPPADMAVLLAALTRCAE